MDSDAFKLSLNILANYERISTIYAVTYASEGIVIGTKYRFIVTLSESNSSAELRYTTVSLPS